MKKLFVGIDLSKEVFDVCYLDKDHAQVASKAVFSNDKKGISKFFKQLQDYRDYDIWVCMEHTGHYGALLINELSVKGVQLAVINPLEIKLSIGMTRGKNDAIDAYRIAYYALTHSTKLQAYILPGEQLQKLKALLSIRQGYVKILVQLKNSLKAMQILNKSVCLIDQISAHQLLIKAHHKEIDKLDQQMQLIVKSNQEIKQSYKKISAVIGVGPITAISCIVETDNFTKFSTGRKFSCHCGVAPFEYKSGSSIRGRTKTSSLSSKKMKAIIFKAAVTAIQHDPQLKNYYERKVGEGKNKLSVLNAVANKVILRIFAVVNREQPFVKLTA